MALEFVSEILLPRLLAASVQSALFVGAVLLLCKLLPRLSAAARAVLWWLVALQLVVGVVWASPLALPLLPAEVLQPMQTTAGVAVLAPANAESTVATMGQASTYAALSAPSWTWTDAVAWLWLLGLSLMIARTLSGYLSTRRMLRDSYPCKDRSLLHALQLAAEAHGLHRSPRLRLSASIDSPQLVGPWRPVLLLPAHHSQSMHADELDMALTHELVHLQRNDLWWGLVPAAAQHLFFFNPLAHLAAREYALARESACDAAVLAGDRHCARAYGQLLLRLGVAPRPSAGLASASPTLHILKRRLVMLQNTASTPRIVAVAIVGLVAIIGVMPYRITAAPAVPASRVAPVASARPVATAMPAPRPQPGGIVATAAHAPVATTTAPGSAAGLAPPPPLPAAPEPPQVQAPAAPVPPPPPPAPPAPPAPAAAVATTGTYTYTTEGDRAYVLLKGNETFAVGGSQDMRDAQRQRHGNEEMLFVRTGNARYVVRDAAILRKLQSVHDEMNALGREQARVGEQQGRLGEQQGQLGMQQAELSTGAAAIAAEHAALAAVAASREAAGDARAAASVRARAAQSERLAALDAQQRGMSEQMEFLSKRQEALGREQAALGARQEAASARASRQARELIDQAIRNGTAQRVQQ